MAGKYSKFKDLRREWDVEVGDVCKNANGTYVVVDIFDQYTDEKDDYAYFANIIYKHGEIETEVPCSDIARDDFLGHFRGWKKAIESEFFND